MSNLIYNGDFESVPLANDDSTLNTSYAWVNGAVPYSPLAGQYGWATGRNIKAIDAYFDPEVKHSGSHSMRLRKLASFCGGVVSNYQGGGSISLNLYFFLLEPGKDYDLSLWIKTENADNGTVYAEIEQYGLLGSLLETNKTATVDGTKDWTEVKLRLKANTSVLYGAISLYNAVSVNPSKAWFDDITLKKA